MDDQAQVKAYNQLVAKVWSDPAFKERLLADLVATLRREGATVPDGVQIRILESSASRTYVPLPAEAPTGEPGDVMDALHARAFRDLSFKSRLVSDPAAVLAEAGISVPAATRVEVVEASDSQGYLLLPAAPEGLDGDTADDDVAASSPAAAPRRQNLPHRYRTRHRIASSSPSSRTISTPLNVAFPASTYWCRPGSASRGSASVCPRRTPDDAARLVYG